MQEDERHWLGDKRDTPAGRAWTAIRAADYARLAEVLDKEGAAALEPVRGPIGHPVTAATQAALAGDTKALSMVLDGGADPHGRANGHMIASPMAWAIEAQSLGCVRLLKEAERWWEEPPPAGENGEEDWADLAVLYHDHIAHPGTEILEAVLETGAPPTPRALGRATEEGMHQDVEVLLEAKANPNATDPRTGCTPLALCLRLVGDAARPDTIGPRMIRILLGAGADANGWCGREGGQRPRPLVAAIPEGADWAIGPLREMRQHGLWPREGRGEAALRALLKTID